MSEVSARRLLARAYGKPSGALVASGQAAIGLALRLAEVRCGDEVIVPSDVCHLVPAAVLGYGAIPVFAPVSEDGLLEPDGVRRALSPKVAAVIGVHHLGLPCDIGKLREAVPPGVSVIEDAAQAFDLVKKGAPLGTHADYVVSSFGPGKPLTFGGGGGVFGTNPRLENLMDRSSATARESVALPIDSPMHVVSVAEVEDALRAASELVSRRRALVRALRLALREVGYEVWEPSLGDAPTWHRLPIKAVGARLQRHARLGADRGFVQVPRRVSTAKLPMFRDRARVVDAAHAPSPWLLAKLSDALALESWLAEAPAVQR